MPFYLMSLSTNKTERNKHPDVFSRLVFGIPDTQPEVCQVKSKARF